MKKNDSNQNNKKYITDLHTDSPEPGETWRKLTMENRIEIVVEAMNPDEKSLIEIRQCLDNGYVYISLLKPLSASIRGLMLLDFELKLKNEVDEGITIWHVPQGDKSSLRRLRGVEVKS